MKFRKKVQLGFTLIELMVSIAIFAVITGLVMVGQSRFGVNLLVTNLAYDVALGIRQAQVYGVSVRAASQVCHVTSGTGTIFDCRYGIHFANSGYFVLFADIDGNGFYNTAADNGVSCITPVGSAPECLTVFKVTQGNSISQFCAGTTDCSNTDITDMDILFKRPDPEPTVQAYNGALGYGPDSNASITVTSSQNVSKTVVVSPSGQVSVQ